MEVSLWKKLLSQKLVYRDQCPEGRLPLSWVPGWSKIIPRSILKVPIRVAIKGKVCEWKAWGEGGISPGASASPLL